MTRTKNTPLSYEPHSIGGEDSDRTGGIETMLQHPVYDIPDWLAALRATRTRDGITLRHAAKRLGMPPSELSGIERGEFQTTPDEVRIFMAILKHGDDASGKTMDAMELITTENTGLVRPSDWTLHPLLCFPDQQDTWHVIDFFAVTIRNLNTREAYLRAVGQFLDWCEDAGATSIEDIRPVTVAAYAEDLGRRRSVPTVKQHLAAIGGLFNWLVSRGVMPSNPAASVRRPKHVHLCR